MLLKLGLPYIDGYKPAKNYQRSLVDAVRVYLDANPTLVTMLDQATETTPDVLPKLDNWQRMFEAPPDDTPLPDDPEVLLCLPMCGQMPEGNLTHHPAFSVGL